MSDDQLQLVGWALFSVSGLFFLAQGIRTGDALTLGGAIAWMIGVGFFLAGSHWRR